MRKSFLEGEYGGRQIAQIYASVYRLIDHSKTGDNIRQQAAAICKSFGLDYMDLILSTSWNDFICNPNIFRFSDDFARELNKVDLDTHTSKINFNIKPTLIEIPGDMLQITSPNKPYVEAFYIISEYDKVVIWMLSNQADGVSEATAFSLTALKQENLTIKELINKLIDPEATFDQFDLLEKQLKFLFNALLYLQSGDPDLREYKAPVKPDGIRDRTWRRSNKNASLVNATIVGFGYKKPNLRHAEESEVIGHFRWQPWGKERAKVKLIWIMPHVRTYEKEEPI